MEGLDFHLCLSPSTCASPLLGTSYVPFSAIPCPFSVSGFPLLPCGDELPRLSGSRVSEGQVGSLDSVTHTSNKASVPLPQCQWRLSQEHGLAPLSHGNKTATPPPHNNGVHGDLVESQDVLVVKSQSLPHPQPFPTGTVPCWLSFSRGLLNHKIEYDRSNKFVKTSMTFPKPY